MEAVERRLNIAFEALGSPIRAKIEEGDLVLRDLILTEGEEGYYEVFEASSPDAPVHKLPIGDPAAVAGILAIHVVRRIISTSLED